MILVVHFCLYKIYHYNYLVDLSSEMFGMSNSRVFYSIRITEKIYGFHFINVNFIFFMTVI